MPAEFVDHAETENWAFRSVMQNVEADKAGIQVAIGETGLRLAFGHSTSSIIASGCSRENLCRTEQNSLYMIRVERLSVLDPLSSS